MELLIKKKRVLQVISISKGENLLCLLVKHNTLELPVSLSSVEPLRNIGEFGAKKLLTDHRTTNAIQSFWSILFPVNLHVIKTDVE